MKRIIKYIILVFIVIALIVFSINFYIIFRERKKIILLEDAKNKKEFDCILVLGAGIRNGKPTHMLEDRLLESIKLYNNNVSEKIIMSGDHGNADYDEVNLMKQFAIDKGVPSENIFMDHAGFSTYESIYRAKEIFKAKKILIVTQKYHLYRALYISDKLEIEAYGVPSNPRKYIKQSFREIREIVARNKDFFNCIIKPKPKYLGDTIPVSGDGNVTNDK